MLVGVPRGRFPPLKGGFTSPGSGSFSHPSCFPHPPHPPAARPPLLRRNLTVPGLFWCSSTAHAFHTGSPAPPGLLSPQVHPPRRALVQTHTARRDPVSPQPRKYRLRAHANAQFSPLGNIGARGIFRTQMKCLRSKTLRWLLDVLLIIGHVKCF